MPVEAVQHVSAELDPHPFHRKEVLLQREVVAEEPGCTQLAITGRGVATLITAWVAQEVCIEVLVRGGPRGRDSRHVEVLRTPVQRQRLAFWIDQHGAL